MSPQTPVYFEGLSNCFYEQVAFRPPRKGEWYLSGAAVMAYHALNDLGDKYQIVRPTFKAIRSPLYAPGKPMELTP